MPSAAPRPCGHPGCRELVRGGSYCPAHKRVQAGSFADRARGSRQERGYGSGWDARRKRALARDCGLCQQCLREGRVTAVGDRPYSAWCDHIVPKAEGGTDDEANLQTLCRSCHQAKTDAEKARGVRRAMGTCQPPGGG